MAIDLIDLPEDVLTIIFSYCKAEDFLATCCTCKNLYSYRQHAAYWRTLTSLTFRLPVSPLLKADGARWYYLYKRLRTQTKLYTWGQGLKGNLGLGRSPQPHHRGPILRSRINRVGRPGTFSRASSSWPTESHVPDDIEVIADLQCGGWSTSILSSSGSLYVTGIIDAMDDRPVGEATEQFRKLNYLTQSTTAIKQFSSGRRHILALTDHGEILSWDRINAGGLKVFFRPERNTGAKATKVVAGWAQSSAYVPEIGIIYWQPIKNDSRDEMLDGSVVSEVVIPETARNKYSLVEVVSYVVLEDFIVWITSDSKVWACKTHVETTEQSVPSFQPFEVPGYTSTGRKLQDIQGQFNKFAVFTSLDEVLAGDVEHLKKCNASTRSTDASGQPVNALLDSRLANHDLLASAKPPDVAALQHNGVISLAFGDHHYHALHANGTITSYGNDPQTIGALGLGTPEDGGRFRGLHRTGQANHPHGDSRLLAQAENRGRNIWFEPEKRDWLRWMEETLKDGSSLSDVTSQEGTSARPLYLWQSDPQKQLMFSEWVEQEGSHWNDGPDHLRVSSDLEESDHHTQDDFHLDAYFTVAVAAAGWHSGALVLVDEDKAHVTRQKWLTTIPTKVSEEDGHEEKNLRFMPGSFETKPADPESTYVWKVQGFPKVVLPDGYEMPGEGDPRPWKDGQPELPLEV